jgi:glycosidase
MKDPELRDNPPSDPGHPQFHKDLGEYSTQLHLHDRAHADTHEVYREIRRLLDAHSRSQPRVSLGEIHVFELAELCSYYGAELDEIHMPCNFTLLNVRWSADDVRRVAEAMEAALPPGAWPNWVLGNHDEHRIASRIGERAARAAMLLLLTLRGTPTLYYGDEIGMTDVPIPEELVQDPWERNVPGRGLGRDPERTPMQWDAGPNAGFTAAGVRPWLPLAPDAATRNVESQSSRPDSMLELTRKLLTVRRRHPALQQGSYRPIAGAPPGTLAFVREHEADRVAVLVNFTGDAAHASLERRWGRALVSTHGEAAGAPQDGYTLRPDEGVVLEAVD